MDKNIPATHYDGARDELEMRWGSGAIRYAEDVSRGITLGYDASGRLASIRVHDASMRVAEGAAAAITPIAPDGETLLRSVIDETPYPILVKDDQGNFVLANRALAELYNTTPAQMVGKHDGHFGVSTEMADAFRENCLDILARGRTEVVFEDSRDAVSGEIRHYRSIKKPIRDSVGRAQLLVIAQDITDMVHSQQLVAESERRLQEVLRLTREGIWDWHVPSGRVHHNAQWYALLGYADDEVPATVDGFAELIHPDDKAQVFRRIQEMMDGQASEYYSEHRLRTSKGYIWVRDRGGVSERDAQGRPVRVLGSVTNITERRLQEQLVADQRRRLDDVVEATNIGLFEWNCQTGRQSVDERWASIVGYRVDELEQTVAGTWRSLAHPDDLAVADRIMDQHLSGEIPIFECEVRLRHRSGHWVWVMARAKLISRDAHGHPLLVTGTHQDISRLKEAEAKVRETEELLRSGIETIDEALVIFDPDDRLVYCNKRYRDTYPTIRDIIRVGVSFEQIVRTWKERGGGDPPEEGIDKWVEQRVRAHREGSLFVQRVENGRFMRVLERVSSNGYIVGFRVDITELVEARQAAEAANVAKSRFLATMSHELRTPMNGILGMAQLLQQDDLTEAERVSFASTILQSGEALLALLNDILDLSKVESGKVQLERMPLDPALLLEETRCLFAETVRAKGLCFDLKWAGPAGGRYYTDGGRVRQMLNNLVSNAIKFTQMGQISVKIELQAPPALADGSGSAMLEFTVTDTGIGIPVDKQSLLFHPFTQVDASTTRQYGGTGLGLSIVRSLCTLMGGEVGVSSVPGEGSRFWFRVPVDEALETPAQDALQPAEAGVEPWGKPGGTAKPQGIHPVLAGRVLVVEDHPMNRMVVDNMLRRLGLSVAIAHDGQEGAELVESGETFDLILMDVQMPVLDGYEATRRIRLWESMAPDRKRLPIVALTANAFAADRDKALQAGMDDFIVKPMALPRLREVLGKWLASNGQGQRACVATD